MIASNSTGKQHEQEIKNTSIAYTAPFPLYPPEISTPIGCSQQGLRSNLEDTWFSIQQQSPDGVVTLLGVFDGVGGGVDGEIASASAALSIAHAFAGVDLHNRGHDHGWMFGAMVKAGLGVQHACAGATTGVVALIRDEHVLIGWVGDSRAGCVSSDRYSLRWLTEDHHGMTESGMPALTRWLGAIGTEHFTMHTPELAECTLQTGEQLMLTTDGVHGTLSDDEILMILRGHEHASRSGHTARTICDASIALGSTDNCTCLLYATDPCNLPMEGSAHE